MISLFETKENTMQKGEMEEKKDLRLKKQKVGFTNQNIVELAYLIRDMINHCYGKKLSKEIKIK